MDHPDSDVYWLSTRVRLFKNGKVIFSDTDHEITPQDKMYPMVLHFVDHDEILLNFDQRPSKDLVLRLFIREKSVIKTDTLPSFDGGPNDFAGDGQPRFNATWDNGEQSEDSLGRQLTFYLPILFYKVTHEGLNLDSAMTRIYNKSVYGKFYGFEPSEKLSFLLRTIDRRSTKEWKKMESARKLNLNAY